MFLSPVLDVRCVRLDLNWQAFEYTVHSSRMAMQDSHVSNRWTDRQFADRRKNRPAPTISGKRRAGAATRYS